MKANAEACIDDALSDAELGAQLNTLLFAAMDTSKSHQQLFDTNELKQSSFGSVEQDTSTSLNAQGCSRPTSH